MNVVPDSRGQLPERFHSTTKTDTMKQLKVPHIADIEKSDFKTLCIRMETCAAKAWIDTVCWKGTFPYAPDASFSVAVSDTHIAVMYRVCGMDLRAKALEDNGPVWEDSCCEFFVADPADGTYYNFEMNCIGTVLASKRKSRDEFTLFTEEQLGRIRRFSSLERREYDESGDIFCWRTAVCIPLELIGLDGTRLPDSVRANFYKCADKTAHPHFLSWNPVEVPQPDFHRPEFFGKLEF